MDHPSPWLARAPHRRVIGQTPDQSGLSFAAITKPYRILTEYEQQIKARACQPGYQPAVRSLTCYKGIKQIFALTMMSEIGNVRRFAHPRQLVSWMGMDIREYFSGGKPHRFGITKQGNRYRRTAFVEANQRRSCTTRLGREMKARRT